MAPRKTKATAPGPARKFGWLAPYPESAKPRLKLAKYLRLPPPPASADWYSRVPAWPMYLNDQIGDCTVAEVAHQIESASAYTAGAPISVDDAAVLAAYRAISGYDPANPATDAGAVIQDVLGYWRRVGIDGHRALAFAQVDPRNHDEVRQAISLFGSVDIGLDLPQSALDQFDAKRAWSTVPNDGGIVGGHSVGGVGYGVAATPTLQRTVVASDGDYVYVVTWGAIVPMTWDFWDHYVEEAWAVILPEWLDAAGHTPTGIDLHELGNDLAELTGDPNPFPSAPGPAPVPPARAGCVTVTGILAALGALAALALLAAR